MFGMESSGSFLERRGFRIAQQFVAQCYDKVDLACQASTGHDAAGQPRNAVNL
jgi:hypothetical protein